MRCDFFCYYMNENSKKSTVIIYVGDKCELSWHEHLHYEMQKALFREILNSTKFYTLIFNCVNIVNKFSNFFTIVCDLIIQY